VTLVTCTPYGVNSHRLLVRGLRIAFVPGAEAKARTQEAAGLSTDTRHQITVAIVTTAAMSPVLVAAVVWRRRHDQQTPTNGRRGYNEIGIALSDHFTGAQRGVG
jgi:sortase A